jgi:hypothetical protein
MKPPKIAKTRSFWVVPLTKATLLPNKQGRGRSLIR